MKYNSIREYFYKFHNLLYALVLVPLLGFIFFYLEIQSGKLVGPFRYNHFVSQVILAASVFVVLIGWIVTFYKFRKSLKVTKSIPSLGDRLDKYYSLTTVRFVYMCSCSVILAVGFYLTENQALTVLFVINMATLSLLWPLPSKICNDLGLRGDERTMVLFKKDTL